MLGNRARRECEESQERAKAAEKRPGLLQNPKRHDDGRFVLRYFTKESQEVVLYTLFFFRTIHLALLIPTSTTCEFTCCNRTFDSHCPWVRVSLPTQDWAAASNDGKIGVP